MREEEQKLALEGKLEDKGGSRSTTSKLKPMYNEDGTQQKGSMYNTALEEHEEE